MNTDRNKFVVGLSANAEFVFSYDGTRTEEKVPLIDASIQLSGSAADVAIGLNKLGSQAHLLGVVGERDDDASFLLKRALEKNHIDHTLYPVLESTSIAVLPGDTTSGRNRVIGKRGAVIHERVEETSKKIQTMIGPGDWTVATGVRVEEVDLAIALLGNAPGRRVMIPNYYLCSHPSLKRALKHTDILVLNRAEMLKCEMNLEEIHDLGPELVVVTEDEHGGVYSLRGVRGDYEPMPTPPGVAIHPAGAGDWFVAGLLAAAAELSAKSLDIVTLQKCLAYAARVASKKITMQGAGNGPCAKEL